MIKTPESFDVRDDGLAVCLQNFFKELSVPFNQQFDFDYVGDGPFIFTAGENSRVAFYRLESEINAAILAAEARGITKGQNFLAQINAGELTMSDLDEKTRDAERFAQDHRTNRDAD